ncbi:MAG: acyl-CoA dehydrogenase [Proteobacteria bacterium]|nr:acyl-CoA dehydrogenase [Pseudomonadota bacterium]
MSNLLVNTRDQRFVLFEQVGIDKLFKIPKYSKFNQELVDMFLKEAEKFAVEILLPTFKKTDNEDPAYFKDGIAHAPACFKPAYQKFIENGWSCPPAPEEVGGQDMPMSVFTACNELFGAANYSFCMYPELAMGAAGLIGTFGTPEQMNKYGKKMFAGEWAGTMCLTEPGAGSDVGALRTTAKRLPDGRFSITGTKCFITSGDHDLTTQIVHPVLARIEGDPAGTKGISIFIVPKYKVNDDGSLGESNDVTCVGLEHKMGIHGSATATLNFGENGKCVGELLGKEREGMKVMFKLMNEARLSTGMQGLDSASASYENSVLYAKDRIQYRRIEDMPNQAAPGVAIINHPDIRRSLLWMKAHVEGMRSLNYYIGYLIDLEPFVEDHEEKEKIEDTIGLLTPISKAYCSDKSVDICSLGMDIHGGYGYCQEYPMEQLLRDAKIATLYEGTNYIQSLDLVGRKLGRKGGMAVMGIMGQISEVLEKAKGVEELKAAVEQMEPALQAVNDLVMQLGSWGMSGEFILPVLNARSVLMILGDILMSWRLVDAALIAQEKLQPLLKKAGAAGNPDKIKSLAAENDEVAFYLGKVSSAQYFAVNILPTMKGRCEAIKLGDRTPVSMPDNCFESR